LKAYAVEVGELEIAGRWTWTEFAADSPLEEGGFEPSVPLPKSPHLPEE
jgi:hypothetical protein